MKKPDGYEGFIEEKVAGELLDYWFPRVLLQNESRRFSIGITQMSQKDRQMAHGFWFQNALDILHDKIVQAHAILEKHCFECHGENGTHKDVLLMDNQLELWDADIINPGDPDSLYII